MRAAITLSISVGLLGLVVLVACNGAPLPVGKFKGEHHLDTQPGGDPVVVAQLKRVILEIDEDGKAKLEDGGFPYDGQMSRSGDTLNFEVLAASGVNIGKQPDNVPRNLEFKVQKDGNILYKDAVLVRQP